MSRRVRTVVADDEDFGTASKLVDARVVDERYPYSHGLLWRCVSAFLYYVVAPVPVWLLSKVYGLRIRNRRAIRSLGGCYIYGNHTHWVDDLIPYLISFPVRASIVTGPTAVSMPLIRHLVSMLGGIPLNSTEAGKAAFREALDRAVKQGGPVAIFPEAHEWPYYNGIRDFPPYSFTYPVRSCAPVVAYVVTYTKRFFSWYPPRMTVTIDEPIPPSCWQGLLDPKTYLRDRVLDFMRTTARQSHSYAWIDYRLPGQGRND